MAPLSLQAPLGWLREETRRSSRCAECRPRCGVGESGSREGAVIGELNIREKREEKLRTPPKRRRIIVVTFGSLGDLHPYLGIALGLRARGHDVIVASGECYRGKIQALGLGFAPVRPDSAWVADPELMRWFFTPAGA